ncbi:MAG TPA: hypothetical protein VGW78_03045 [Candidatus Babeliales bacterium]|nr:hypothetical protein [Candidatus Babeliales bacterium]
MKFLYKTILLSTGLACIPYGMYAVDLSLIIKDDTYIEGVIQGKNIASTLYNGEVIYYSMCTFTFSKKENGTFVHATLKVLPWHSFGKAFLLEQGEMPLKMYYDLQLPSNFFSDLKTMVEEKYPNKTEITITQIEDKPNEMPCMIL